MKVCINIKQDPGPAGGGVIFARDLEDFLVQKQVDVVHSLHDDDIDIILQINPFPFLMKTAVFSYIDAYIYKLNHPRTVIIQGIHECDERKGTSYMNDLLVRACSYADDIVYVASWLKPLLENQGLNPNTPYCVILHGSSRKYFNAYGRTKWDRKRPLKIVTHHWGAHMLKGHDVYQRLDQLLGTPTFRERFMFTFIGHYPAHLTYTHTRILPPLPRPELAHELKQHDVYITASRNEPAGLHHIEGALCGLPLLYLNSGALKEYCQGFGLEFTTETFEEKLLELYYHYEEYAEKMQSYHRFSETMGQEYLSLFETLLKERTQETRQRVPHFFIAWLHIQNTAEYVYWKTKRLWNKLTGSSN